MIRVFVAALLLLLLPSTALSLPMSIPMDQDSPYQGLSCWHKFSVGAWVRTSTEFIAPDKTQKNEVIRTLKSVNNSQVCVETKSSYGTNSAYINEEAAEKTKQQRTMWEPVTQVFILGEDKVRFEGGEYPCHVRLTSSYTPARCGTPPVIEPVTLRYEWYSPYVKVNKGVLRSITAHGLRNRDGSTTVYRDQSWKSIGVLLSSKDTVEVAAEQFRCYTVRRVVVLDSGAIRDTILHLSDEFPTLVLKQESKIYDAPANYKNQPWSLLGLNGRDKPFFPASLPVAPNIVIQEISKVEAYKF